MIGNDDDGDAKRRRVSKEGKLKTGSGNDEKRGKNRSDEDDTEKRPVMKKGKYYRAFELIDHSIKLISLVEGVTELIKKSEDVDYSIIELCGTMAVNKMYTECCLDTFVDWCYGNGRYREIKKIVMDEFFDGRNAHGCELSGLVKFPIKGITLRDWNDDRGNKDENA